MADGIHAEVNADALVVRIENASGRIRANIREAVVRMQATLQRLIKDRLKGGNPLYVRSGKLSESWTLRPIEEGDGYVSGPVGSNTIYARIQDQGGTIVPKNGSFLTVQLDAALTGAKVLRFSARQIIESPGAGGYDGTFFAKGVLFGKSGVTITPLFALKTSVTIPAHHYLDGALTAIKPQYEDALRKAIAAALRPGA